MDRPYLKITLDNLRTIAGLMATFPATWFVCGGWAIDAFAGRVTRKHEDLEISIARSDQHLLHDYLPDWQLLKIATIGSAEPDLYHWPRDEHLELPIHQVVVQREGFDPPEFEFFLNEVEGGEWRFRRDQRIRQDMDRVVVMTDWGIPMVAPEVQLLYKARLRRPKDEQDFETVLPLLNADRRAWLRQALEQFLPGDSWIERL